MKDLDNILKIRELIKEYPNDMELGGKVRQLYQDAGDGHLLIYESPDGGETVYKRKMGSDERVLVNNDKVDHEYGLGNDGHYERYDKK